MFLFPSHKNFSLVYACGSLASVLEICVGFFVFSFKHLQLFTNLARLCDFSYMSYFLLKRLAEAADIGIKSVYKILCLYLLCLYLLC